MILQSLADDQVVLEVGSGNMNLDDPCTTFRPDHPDGLRPPRQLRFVFRQEHRARATWSFPTAAEQAVLHS